MDQQEIGALKAELRQFTGSETFYRHPLFPNYVTTEGVQFLAEKAGAYWLIDYIFSNQPQLQNQPFQVWKLKVRDDDSALIRVEDGNDKLLWRFTLEFTDFPLEAFTLWLIDGTLLLPSEY